MSFFIFLRFVAGRSAVSDVLREEEQDVDAIHGVRYVRKMNHPNGLKFGTFDQYIQV